MAAAVSDEETARSARVFRDGSAAAAWKREAAMSAVAIGNSAFMEKLWLIGKRKVSGVGKRFVKDLCESGKAPEKIRSNITNVEGLCDPRRSVCAGKNLIRI